MKLKLLFIVILLLVTSVQATDVLYVYSVNTDQNIVNELNNLGVSYNTVISGKFVTIDYSKPLFPFFFYGTNPIYPIAYYCR